LLGGVFVFRINLRLASLDAALLATAFFLFVPFGIKGSRSFQPDVLMLMLLLWALYLLIRYHDNSSWRLLFWTAGVGSLSILIKPQGLFMLLSTAVVIIGYQDSRKRCHLMVFLLIVMLPTLMYYGYQYLINAAFYNQVKSSFLPHLWFELFYWQFWFKHLWRVIGFSALVGGMFGILITPVGWRRNFLISMWIGYVIFGLFYTYYIHTHDYYHLQFIPAVALPLGVLGSIVLQQLMQVNKNILWKVIIGAILVFSLLLNIGLYLNNYLETGNSSSQAQLAEQIGTLVEHSTQTLFLAPYYGAPLQYHGEVAGKPWPTLGDMKAGQIWGEKSFSAKERLDQFIQGYSPEYFIITDMTEFEAQTELKTLLTTRYEIIKRSGDFIIFDLYQR